MAGEERGWGSQHRGSNIAARMAMMAITTNSSIRVNAERTARRIGWFIDGGGGTGLGESASRQIHRGEDGNDGNHHQQFDQGERGTNGAAHRLVHRWRGRNGVGGFSIAAPPVRERRVKR